MSKSSSENIIMPNTIEKALNTFQNECKDLLYCHCKVQEVEPNLKDPDWPLEFYRNYVSKNIPVIIKNGCKSFDATKKWNTNYFMELLPEKEVTVAITPNGYADGLINWQDPKTGLDEEIFALPEERQMLMKEFLDNIQHPKDNVICYIQRQNSNLTEDFQELFCDIKTDIDWASKAFCKEPEAVNFWMGDTRAITSMHKDFYENIYCVIDGYKDFILIPPSDLSKVTYKKYKIGQFANVSSTKYNIEISRDEHGNVLTVPWIANNPLKCEKELFPNFDGTNIHKVRVNKGDCLYLPSMWFHHVQQSHGCVAVNYWYDMDFDVKFCYYKLLESLVDEGL